jgi:hypothetical protein
MMSRSVCSAASRDSTTGTRRFAPGHTIVYPPSMTRTDPVMNEEASLAR